MASVINNEYIFAGNPHINDTNDLYGDFYAKISRKIYTEAITLFASVCIRTSDSFPSCSFILNRMRIRHFRNILLNFSDRKSVEIQLLSTTP